MGIDWEEILGCEDGEVGRAYDNILCETEETNERYGYYLNFACRNPKDVFDEKCDVIEGEGEDPFIINGLII